MKAALPTTPSALLARAAEMDHARRETAVNEFLGYRMVGPAQIQNRESGAIYTISAGERCNCPDFCGRVQGVRDRMTEAGIENPERLVRCKHYYTGRLLIGRDVRVGFLVLRAIKK